MIAALLLLAALQTPWQEHNCDDPQNQMDMNFCAAIGFERADAALNAAWRQAIAGERAADRERPRDYDVRPSNESVLRQAQRAWIAFRDSHCTSQAYGEARGGSMEPMVYNGCRARLTRERIAQLRGEQEPQE